jgi:hypothetical protein
MDFSFPYIIQLLREYLRRVDELIRGKLDASLEAKSKENEKKNNLFN